MGCGKRLTGKSDQQLGAMRVAGLVVARTLELVRESLEPGRTTGELDAIAEGSIRGDGAVPSFKGYHGFPGSLCVSVNDEVVHGIPGERRLAAGDLVSVDCGAIVDGWHGDAARSWVVPGAPADEATDALVEDTRLSMWHGIAALRTGGRLFAIGDAIQELLEEREAQRGLTYGIVEEYGGHGIGREMHMEPWIPNYAARGSGGTVPKGLTVAIEPMVTLGSPDNRTLADDWTVVTQDGSRACHWENTVAVTEGGLWVLTELDGGAAGLAEVGATFAPLGD
ncbi:type I methionyl aminopeptidase [Kytococcus sedentarius]|nr:type I methionyl aminopeptidase [Kytococcus sedentarius]QQB65222.1 type I methionyl aminopeptidase [Kytococcus sedentarius]